MVFNSATIVGPALAGELLRLRGPALIYALNAASFVAVIVALLLMSASGRAEADAPIARINLGALREGLRFVWRTPIIVQTMTLDFIATFFSSATALLPIFAAEILNVGARGLGLLAAAPGAGSIIAGADHGQDWRRYVQAGQSGAGISCDIRSGNGCLWLVAMVLALTSYACDYRSSRHGEHGTAADDPAVGHSESPSRPYDVGQHDFSWEGRSLESLKQARLLRS